MVILDTNFYHFVNILHIFYLKLNTNCLISIFKVKKEQLDSLQFV